MPIPLPGARRLAATLAEDAPHGDLTTQGLGIGDTGGVDEGNAAAGADLLVTSAPCAAPAMDVAVAMAPDGT